MTDVLTPKQRAYCMSQIKGSNTKPEIAVQKGLWALGYRYRLKNKLPGRPDIVFPGKKVAIFIDGCFWHKCPKHFTMPKNRKKFWKDKIEGNVERDKIVNKKLKYMGWSVVRLWEHEINGNLDKSLSKLEKVLNR